MNVRKLMVLLGILALFFVLSEAINYTETLLLKNMPSNSRGILVCVTKAKIDSLIITPSYTYKEFTLELKPRCRGKSCGKLMRTDLPDATQRVVMESMIFVGLESRLTIAPLESPWIPSYSAPFHNKAVIMVKGRLDPPLVDLNNPALVIP